MQIGGHQGEFALFHPLDFGFLEGAGDGVVGDDGQRVGRLAGDDANHCVAAFEFDDVPRRKDARLGLRRTRVDLFAALCRANPGEGGLTSYRRRITWHTRA